MKSSTLHRSNLSRERMSMIEKNVQPKTRAKAPIVYAGIGFVLGLLFSLAIAIIIGLSTYSDIKPEYRQPAQTKGQSVENPAAKVAVVPSAPQEDDVEQVQIGTEEKYTVKSGDTLDKIAIRFYGKYDPDKINKIMEINNIKDATRIQIDQVLIIPLD